MNGRRVKSRQPVENYSPLLAAGLILALMMIAGLGIYWLNDGPRMASAAEALHEERLARGQKLYAGQCAGCHGAQGEGGVGMALNDPDVLKNTPDGVFFSVIRSGVPNTQMPAWSVDYGGPLTDEDVRDLVAWLRTWQE